VITFDHVVAAVAIETGIARDEMLSRNREERVAFARHIAAIVLMHFDFSLSESARRLGRHHTSVHGGVARVREMIQRGEAFGGTPVADIVVQCADRARAIEAAELVTYQLRRAV
jgi:chromosomal replication initiation ATPase DnaA